jgi:hypothetical protein
MLRFVASYLTSNIKSNNANEENLQRDVFNFNTIKNLDFFTTETEMEQPEELDISSLRERKLQELTEKVLLRKIYRQVAMNRHAQDHLPLSQIQEKLEEDDLPLKVLQEKLRQKENSSIYTTIRENINFLLYSKPSKPKKSRPLSTSTTKTDENNINVNNNVFTPRDDRDYDVWDDAVIGHLMNLVEEIGVDITIPDENSGLMDLIDTTGVDTIQDERFGGTVMETTPKVDNELISRVVNEVINEVMKEEKFENKSSRVNNKEFSTFPKRSTKVTIEEDKEKIVAESTSATTVAIGKNAVKNIENNAVKNIKNNVAINIENNSATNIENATVVNTENDLRNIKNDIMNDVQENDIQENTNLESRKIAEEIIDFGETINVAESLLRSNNLMNDNESLNSTKKRKSRRSIFSLGQSSSSNDKNTALRRHASNLSRRGSIHSKKSYENDISRRSSISSKFSFSTTTGVIIEEQNEDGSNNIKFSKRNRKSLQFLKNIWKNNQNLPLANNEERFISSREIRERYYQQIDNVKPDQQQDVYPKTIGTAGDRTCPDYSNFYLSMPNGKWMVRTRTASRKITGNYTKKIFFYIYNN